MDTQAEIFEKSSIPKALATFMVPALLSQLASLILNLTDTYFVGKTCDTDQISAMTICFPIVMLFTCISTVFGVGGNVNFAASISRRDYDSAKKYSVFSVYTAIIIAMIISFLLFFFKAPAFELLGARGEAGSFSRGYVFWTVHIACVPLCFSTVAAQMFTAEGRTRTAGVGLAGAGILNAILDPVFVFVLGMGVVGAAIATCISNFASAAFFIIQYLRCRKESSISFNPGNYSPGNGIAKSTIVIGIPTGITILLLNVCDFVRNSVLSNCSDNSVLAAWGIAQKLANSFMMVIMGFTQGARPLIAYNYGQKSLKRTRKLILGTLVVTLTYSVCVFIIINFFSKGLVWAFLPVEGVADTGAVFIRIWSLGIVGIVLLETLNTAFQCVGNWKFALWDSVAGKLLMIVLVLVLSRVIGVQGVVISQPVADIFTGLLCVVLYFGFVRKKLI